MVAAAVVVACSMAPMAGTAVGSEVEAMAVEATATAAAATATAAEREVAAAMVEVAGGDVVRAAVEMEEAAMAVVARAQASSATTLTNSKSCQRSRQGRSTAVLSCPLLRTEALSMTWPPGPRGETASRSTPGRCRPR